MVNQFTKEGVKCIVKFVLVWTVLNAIFNILGLWISKLLNEAEYSYLNNINTEFVKPLLYQTIILLVCYLIAYQLIKNKNFAKYSFLLIQIIIFHVIFVLNIQYDEGFFFASTFRDPGLVYLGINGQYLIDVLYQFIPPVGNYEYGQFIPHNNVMFYMQWVFLVLVYFFGLTWITSPVVKFIFENKEKTVIPIVENEDALDDVANNNVIENKIIDEENLADEYAVITKD